MKRPILRPPADHGRTRAAIDPGLPKLQPREAKFVSEYVVDYNGVRAAKAAGFHPERAGYVASTLIRQPNVLAEINRIQVENRQKLALQREDTMQFWYDLANADVSELIPMRVGCCRHCWGDEHQYQHTDGELRELYRKHRAAYQNVAGGAPVMDEQGGGGFDPRRDPCSVLRGADHDCPECSGMGVMYPVPLDVTKLSRGAKLLIGGIKVGKDGAVEIKLADRMRAQQNLEEHLGFRRARRALLTLDFEDITDEQLDALLSEARTRGLLRDDEMPRRPPIDVTPQRQEVLPPSGRDDERVS